APGIPSFDELKRIYHYDRINKETEVYGVIGDPVGHSLSPLIHNAALFHLGRNGVYLPFQVPRGKLADFVKAFAQFNLGGYSVTIPHKEDAAEKAQVKSSEVLLIGAANTLVREKDGFHAYNTDFQAARDSLLGNLREIEEGVPDDTLEGKSVLMLGAGGVARAVAHAVHREKALLTIANRTVERGQRLAEEVGCRFTDWEARHNVLCDILINCTSVGMHPNLDESPIHQSFLKP